MDILKLMIVFGVLVVMLWLKRPLYQGILGAAAAVCILFGIAPAEAFNTALLSVTGRGTLSVLLVFYLITFLQRMLEKRDFLNLAQASLNGIFNNRRINASLAPVFIGLLPSAGAVIICGDIVEKSVGPYLSPEEKTFVTSYFRHIPESFLPTYTSIIIAISLTGGRVSVSSFLVGMLPLVFLLAYLGYLFCLRKIPKDTGMPPSMDKRGDIRSLCRSLWSIALAIGLIIGAGMPVYAAVACSIVLSVFINKFTFSELKPMFLSAVESKIVTSTICIMIFKDIMASTGVIESLPGAFERLPVPGFLVFAMIFFFGTIISGSQAIIVLCMPLAFAAEPQAGLALFLLLMGMTYAAMQISPTHVCLAIVSEYFGVGMGALIRKNLPVIFVFAVLLIGYYVLLSHVFGL